MSTSMTVRPCDHCGSVTKSRANLALASEQDGWSRYYFCSTACLDKWLRAHDTYPAAGAFRR